MSSIESRKVGESDGSAIWLFACRFIYFFPFCSQIENGMAIEMTSIEVIFSKQRKKYEC